MSILPDQRQMMTHDTPKYLAESERGREREKMWERGRDCQLACACAYKQTRIAQTDNHWCAQSMVTFPSSFSAPQAKVVRYHTPVSSLYPADGGTVLMSSNDFPSQVPKIMAQAGLSWEKSILANTWGGLIFDRNNIRFIPSPRAQVFEIFVVDNVFHQNEIVIPRFCLISALIFGLSAGKEHAG